MFHRLERRMQMGNSMSLSPQLTLVDASLPEFFCFISCFVFVSDSSANANCVVANTPATKTAANAAIVNILLFMVHMPIKLDYI